MGPSLAPLLALALAVGCGGAADAEFGWIDGASRAYAGRGSLAIRWTQQLTPDYEGPYMPVERAIALLDPPRDRIYVGSSAGGLYAMTPGGRRLYRYDAGGAIESQPALDPEADELYVGTEQGVLHALEATTGELRWRDRADGPVRQRPLLLQDAVYVVSDADVVTAFAREDGETLWSYRREAPETFSISEHAGLAAGGGKLLTAFTDGVIVALDPSDGTVVWERDTSVDVDTEEQDRPQFVDVDTTPVVVGRSVYAASFSAGLYQIDLADGSVIWHDPERTGVVGITTDRRQERLFLSSADAGVICLSLPDHREIWTREIERGSPTSPVVAGQAVLVGESGGSFLALSVQNGAELSRFDAGYGFTAPADVADGLGFVLANSGSLYAFSVP